MVGHHSLTGRSTLLVSRLSHRTALFACLGQSSVAFLEDCLVVALQFIDECHVSNRAVEPLGAVLRDEAMHQPLSVVE